MKTKKKNPLKLSLLALVFFLPLTGYSAGVNSSVVPSSAGMPTAVGAPGAPTASGSPSSSAVITPSVGKPGEARKVDVDQLKKKYWDYGSNQNLSVVQNRAYTKAGRMSLGLTIGTVNNDPFKNSYTLGGKIGYNFSEYLSLNVMAQKVFNTDSSAYAALVTASGFGSNSNPIQAIYGADLTWNVLYGKLSVLGMAIVHFDLYLFGGAGIIAADNGNSFAPWIGIGQQAFLTQFMTLSLDYRVYRFDETIKELFRPATLGQVVGNRTNYSGAVTLGINFFIF